MAASAMKKRMFGAAWATGGAAGLYMWYRCVRDFEESTPCYRDAIRALSSSSTVRQHVGNGDLSVARWPRQRVVDQGNGLARATFEVRGELGNVLAVMGARRRPKAQLAYEEALEEMEEEDELVGTGWRRYWSRPWELKAWLLSRFQSKAATGAADEEEPTWDLETLLVLPGGDIQRPTVLLGNATALPEYEAWCVRRDSEAKNERSQRRLRIIMGIAFAGAMAAGAARLIKSLRVSQSYGFVRRALTRHSQVIDRLGPDVQIQHTSGQFGKSFINARLRLVGNTGAVAEVDVSATRSGSEPWRVSLARMRWAFAA